MEMSYLTDIVSIDQCIKRLLGLKTYNKFNYFNKYSIRMKHLFGLITWTVQIQSTNDILKSAFAVKFPTSAFNPSVL